MTGNQPTLGILTIYLNDRKMMDEKPMFQKMTVAGQKLGMNVMVFTPDDVEARSKRIYAHVYLPQKKTWCRRWLPFPHVIYDRARFQKSSRFRRFAAFRKKIAHLNFINRPLRNKWVIYKLLSGMDPFRPHLPATRLYESPASVHDMLKRHPVIYFKPINGTGGRGILRIERLANGMLKVQGRDQNRRIIQPRIVHPGRLSFLLRSWDRRGDRYIVQQGLHTQLPDGRVHDFRLLVQKDGNGEWAYTGCAGRIGPRNSITSNLHGGGTASTMQELLGQWEIDQDQIAHIQANAESLGIEVAKTLEQAYGTLCELALDLVIDRSGHLWILEVNHKPAREVFLKAGEHDVYRQAVMRPLEFALWKYRQSAAHSPQIEPMA
jgi:glutathione synthase/RimK-type ligase-like ATP-grasp enzyme